MPELGEDQTMRHVTATEANREFSSILREVREGEVVMVTAKGKPVAVISPIGDRPKKTAARNALFKRLRAQKCMNLEWSREELYDD